jgi:uncharacterized protein YndB with AHSA1/START domain
MKPLCLALTLAASSLLAQSAAKPQAFIPSNRPANITPGKVLLLELTIPAPVSDVWKAFSTSDGLMTWLTPSATVDLRPGGEWICHFSGGSTGGGTIVSFVPQQELVIAALAPDKFPNVRSRRTTAKFSFEARGSSTLVRLTQTGWQDGDEWNKAYEYLAVGNAQLLATLHHRFISGPIDWTK